jgi:hypothetical protein
MNEATDAVMATLGEYDALWDGMLFPEIVDAEFYDCPNPWNDWSPILPGSLFSHLDPDLIQALDRFEALNVLIEVVKCYVENSLDVPLFCEEVDAELYDCPLDDASWYACILASDDWPSVDSLK